MQILLLAAAIINVFFTRDVRTSLLLVVLTIVNAVMGLNGESKAEASLASLQKDDEKYHSCAAGW